MYTVQTKTMQIKHNNKLTFRVKFSLKNCQKYSLTQNFGDIKRTYKMSFSKPTDNKTMQNADISFFIN